MSRGKGTQSSLRICNEHGYLWKYGNISTLIFKYCDTVYYHNLCAIDMDKLLIYILSITKILMKSYHKNCIVSLLICEIGMQ